MGVIQWEHDAIFTDKKKGVIKWESFLKMGVIYRWEQNVKNKKGSFSDRWFENGGQYGRT